MTPPVQPRRSRRRALGRFALRWIVFLGLVYAGAVLVFWFLEKSLVFYPATAAESWEAPVAPGTRDVTVSIDGNYPIHMWWLPPADPSAGAVLVAHGNGGNLSHRGQLAADLGRTTRAGILMFDYPGYGKCGGKPSEAGCYAAGEAAYRWLLEEANIPANRIVLMGESLGGGTAVELATRHEHAPSCFIRLHLLPAAAKAHYPWLPTYTHAVPVRQLAKIGWCHRPVLSPTARTTVVPLTHGEALSPPRTSPRGFVRL